MNANEQYISELSDFIWKKVIEYYDSKTHNIQLNAGELSASLEYTKQIGENERVRREYDDLEELYKTNIAKLTGELTSLQSSLASEKLTTKLLQSEITSYKSQLANLLEQLKTIKGEHNDFVCSLKNDYREQLEYMKDKVEESNNERKTLLKLFNEQLDQQVSLKVDAYKKQNEELKRENEYYYNLYVDKSKGKFYETELFPRLLKYNTKHMGGQWRIEHVGSTAGEKCDFVFKHKDSDAVILMDTKNNIQSQPVNNIDMDKFLRDVSMDENKAIGGILLANSRICNKKEFEVNEHQGRTLVFISNYNQDNIAFVFSILDFIYSKYKEDKKEIDLNRVKHGSINDIKFLKERSNTINNEKRKMENYLVSLENRFIELYGQNSDEWITINNAKPANENTTQQDAILNFDELEKDRIVIGKRTKYYLCYDDPKTNKQKIQYFRDNNKRNSKIDKLNTVTQFNND